MSYQQSVNIQILKVGAWWYIADSSGNRVPHPFPSYQEAEKMKEFLFMGSKGF